MIDLIYKQINTELSIVGYNNLNPVSNPQINNLNLIQNKTFQF